LIAALVALFAASAPRADAPESFRQTVKTLYAFHPHALTDAQIDAKSKELDAFWEKVKSDTATYLPLLREALSDETSQSFFFYDGSKLLLSLSKDRSDEQLALTSIARCDIRDVQRDDYLYTVFHMAHDRLDTSEAAFKVLADPKFTVNVPQHALVLGQDFSLIYMLLPTSEDFFVQKAVDRLSTETEPTAQKSLLRLLWYSVTEAGDRAVAAVAASERYSSPIREVARSLQSSTASMESDSKPPKKLLKEIGDIVPKDADFDRIKEVRRTRLSRVSDEALLELDALTWLLRIKRPRH